MADIKDLPRSTLICIVKNIKRELAKGKMLTEFNITENKKENSYSLEYFWEDAKGGLDE